MDDDEDIRTIVQLALEVVGDFEVMQCPDGPSAVAAAPGFAPQLLLLDMMMPGMSGLEVWEAITRHPALAKVPTIFVTAKAEDTFSRELLEKGAMGVIVKPFDPMTLFQQIQDAWTQ